VLKEAGMSQGAGGRAVVGQPPTRREELDLLRVLVVVGLVFFHTAVIFGTASSR
jgi:peptidoglycan/LPS O-acetylase OafA/YrhL